MQKTHKSAFSKVQKLLIFLLILTSCAKSKQAIESVQPISQCQENGIVLEPKSKQEIRIEARNECVKIRQENRTDRRKSKDGVKNHKQDVKLAKNENKTDVKMAVQAKKVAKFEAKKEVKVIKQEKKVQVLNRWIWIVALVVLLVILILFYLFIRKFLPPS